MLAPSAHALTLGDINVRSTLGQRLNASVPVRLSSGEALASACVTPGHKASDLRRVPGATVTTPEATREGLYELEISSQSALYEPMYELELKVNCPGAPVVVRQYVLMLDLPAAIASSAAASPDAANPPATAASSAIATLPAQQAAAPVGQPRAPLARATASASGTTIASGSRYRVSDGDTLSAIAVRVRDRKVSLRVLADAIQAANPDAFIRNDANLIKLGSEILIPEVSATSSPLAGPMTLPVQAAAVPPAPTATTATTPPPPASVPEIPASTTTPPAAAGVPPPAGDIQPAQVQAAPIPAAQRPATTEIAVAPADEPIQSNSDEPSPLLAAGAGILFGLCISALLWFRGRFPARKQPETRQVASIDPAPRTDTAAGAAVVAPLVTRTTEPGFSVSYSTQYDDSLDAAFSSFEPEPATLAQQFEAPKTAAPAASDEITSQLEELFDGTDTTIRKRLDAGKSAAPHLTESDLSDGFQPDEIESGTPVDFLVGELPDEISETMAAPTADLAGPDTRSTSDSGTVDIHTLVSAATTDDQQAQTLLEALTLLERDYEEELTASQILDPSLVRKFVANDDAGATRTLATPPRKKVF